MKKWLIAWVALLGLWSSQAWGASGALIILCYHEVVTADGTVHDPLSVDARGLVRQMDWMQAHGYRFVSLQDVLDDRAGRKPLPDKPVLLTFDDGYRSVYTKVYPVLKLFHAPALIALVGSWLEVPEGQTVTYGEATALRDKFLSWQQIREMQDSGLVEVANHSYDAHHGLLANPQGNLEPALFTHAYQAPGYEDHAAFLERVRQDLRRNSELLRLRLGRQPRAMVWPYGAYTQEGAEIAAQEGMPVTMNLDAGANTPDTPLGALRRVLLDVDADLPDLASQLQNLERWPVADRPRPRRIMHVDLDYIYDADAQRQEANLGRLLDRVKAMGVSTVYLQAFADPEGEGVARALYFPNRHLPMRADLFNRAAWQLQTRAGVKVYAWMPVLGFVPPTGHPLADQLVLARGDDGQVGPQGYRRLTPYDPAVRQFIQDIYEDLARAAHFSGLLFHDDATLSDQEDASVAAQQVRAAEGLPADIDAVRSDPAALKAWTSSKTRLLSEFTLALAATVRRQQPALRTARNLYAPAVLNPASEAWLAQSFVSALRDYNYVAVMAMPYMEQAADPRAWMKKLFDSVAAVPGALERTVFELQSVDWRRRRPVPSEELAETVDRLHTLGARHIAYYPDDAASDQPRLKALKPVFSLTEKPER